MTTLCDAKHIENQRLERFYGSGHCLFSFIMEGRP